MKKIIVDCQSSEQPSERHDLREKIIMCPPTYFDVVDVKNAHMQDQVGKVDKLKAQQQWDTIKQAVLDQGYEVFEVSPVQGLEDMVFTANAGLVGQNAKAEKIALLSNMVHESRKKETPSYGDWFESNGYQVQQLSQLDWAFEGNGDAIWHPQKRMIWGAYGFRTKKEVYEEISTIFDASVCVLKLQKEHFYHLDTCFCPLNADTVMYYPQAFDEQGRALIQHYFKKTIEVSEEEAQNNFACNSLVLGNTVFIGTGNPKTVSALKSQNFKVIECNTSEFLKSGGSICCMKLKVY